MDRLGLPLLNGCALFGFRPTIEGPAETCGLGIVLRAEPAVGLGGRRIARATLQMIDADIAGDAGAHREFALDAAIGRHREIFRKQRLADLPVAVGPAGGAVQAAVLLAGAKFLACDKAASPQTKAGVPGAGFILEETALGGGFEIQRKAGLNQLLVQARRFALDGAKADMALLGSLVWTEIIAADGSSASTRAATPTSSRASAPVPAPASRIVRGSTRRPARMSKIPLGCGARWR